jgi:heme-degrading monooxygenase HmoA
LIVKTKKTTRKNNMIVTVFRSRLNAQSQDAYQQTALRMSALAKGVPGYVSHKGFTADDGERVTIVEFESEEGLRAWATHPEHVQAKKIGRSLFFTEYRVQVCKVIRDTVKTAPAPVSFKASEKGQGAPDE